MPRSRSATPGRRSPRRCRGPLPGLRVALSVDLGGAFEVDHRVAAVVEEAGRTFARGGLAGLGGAPGPGLADDTFRTLRAWHFQAKLGPLLAAHPDAFKQSLADNIRLGEGLTGADVARAYAQRTALAETMRLFFTEHDVLVLPVSQVPPFPADQEFPTDINGRPMETYLDWMRSAYFITVTGLPRHLPAGRAHPRGAAGRDPGRRPARADRRLLEIAAAFEAAGPVA